MEETYYETSFRFKWGVGSIIEFLTQTLEWLQQNTPETEVGTSLCYELEQIRYCYSSSENCFVETDKRSQNRYSTKTNFVLEIKDKELFDQLVSIGNDYLKDFKETVITEWQNTGQPNTAIDYWYSQLGNFDAILTYTQLRINWYGEHSLVIDDPNPKVLPRNEAYLG